MNLGPQLVQLMNGYRNLLSAGSASSRRQSAQVAVSAAIRVRRRPAGSLATISKDAVPAGAIAAAVTRSTLASGGASRSSARRNSADRRRRAFHLGEHPVDVVTDQAGEAEPGRQRVHEGPEADPLDDALHPDGRPGSLDRFAQSTAAGTGRRATVRASRVRG